MIRTSEETDQLCAALIAARATLDPSVSKDDAANAGRFSYTFASLGAVLDHVGDALVANGLWWLAGQDVEGVTVRVYHSSGQWAETTTPTVAADARDAQKVGGAFTFGRRYGLVALLGLATEDDDAKKARQPRRVKETAADTAARQAGHHRSWTAEARTNFCKAIVDLGFDYDEVCMLAEEGDPPLPRPSHMSKAQRRAFYHDLVKRATPPEDR